MFNMETVEELFRVLDAQLNDDTKATIAAMSVLDARVNLHLGLNALIRSLAFYKNGSRDGLEFFGRLGMPDDASAVLGTMYWHHLRGEKITKDVLLNILEMNWCVSEDEAQNLAELFAKDYARYVRH